MDRSLTLAVLVAPFLLATACHRSASNATNRAAGAGARGAAAAELEKQLREAERAADKVATDERGFGNGMLTIGSGTTRVAGGWSGRALGPFALGMTVEDVGATARRNSMMVSFALPDGDREGWCLKSGAATKPSSVLAPVGLSANLNGPGDRFTSYVIIFAPKLGRLTAVSVQQTSPRTRRVGPDVDTDWRPAGDIGGYVPCKLLARESRMLTGWVHIENLGLRDILGQAQLDRSLLSQGVRTALDQWEQQTTVPCDQTMSDCPSVDPAFDGWWEKDGRFVVSYSLYLGGETATVRDFIVVANPDGSFAWTGNPREFAAHGLEGKRERALGRSE